MKYTKNFLGWYWSISVIWCQLILPGFQHSLVHMDTLDAGYQGHSRLLKHTPSYRHSFQAFTVCLATGEVTMNKDWFSAPRMCYLSYVNLKGVSPNYNSQANKSELVVTISPPPCTKYQPYSHCFLNTWPA